MDESASPEFSQFINVIPGYSHDPIATNFWLIILAQWFLCLVWSVCCSYFGYKMFYGDPEKSWTRIIQLMDPILKRIQNLEKEKTIWHSYMEWIEEYCNVYYGLLNYTNTKVGDLEKMLKYPSLNFKSISDTSYWSKESAADVKPTICAPVFDSKPEEEVVADKEPIIEEQNKDVTTFDEFQLLSDFSRVFTSLKTIHDGAESDDTETLDDGTRSLTVSDILSMIETTEDYFKDELESFKESSDDEKLAKTFSSTSQI